MVLVTLPPLICCQPWAIMWSCPSYGPTSKGLLVFFGLGYGRGEQQLYKQVCRCKDELLVELQLLLNMERHSCVGG